MAFQWFERRLPSIQGFECGLSKCSIKTRLHNCCPRLKDMQSLILKTRNQCRHNRVREIGQDYDRDENPVRLVRCQRCGLLMRETLPIPRS